MQGNIEIYIDMKIELSEILLALSQKIRKKFDVNEIFSFMFCYRTEL